MAQSVDNYRNVWRIIEGKTAREIVGFSEDHYARALSQKDMHGVNLLQVEFDLFDDHPRLLNRFSRLFGEEEYDSCYKYGCLQHAIHGTAAASIVADEDKGVVPGAELYFTGISKAGLFGEGIDPYKSILPVLTRVNERWDETALSPGDILSISLQFSQESQDGKKYNFPIDAELGVRKQIELLSEKGLIVFVAAGNSGLDLDREVFVDEEGYELSYRRETKSSPAIKVGYTGTDTGNRHWSNYGSQVEFFAPSGSVSAACYTYDASTRTTDLIETFSGGFGKSSAATPIVASVAAKVQRFHKTQNSGKHLGRDDMVEFLKKVSEPPAACSENAENAKNVGVFPNGPSLEALYRA